MTSIYSDVWNSSTSYTNWPFEGLPPMPEKRQDQTSLINAKTIKVHTNMLPKKCCRDFPKQRHKTTHSS